MHLQPEVPIRPELKVDFICKIQIKDFQQLESFHPFFSKMVNTRSSRWLDFFAHLTLVYPLLFLGAFYGQWLLCWAVLGHSPRVFLDDLSCRARWLDFLGVYGAMGCIPMACGGIVTNLLFIIRRRLRMHQILRRIPLFLMFWLGTYFLLWLDPGEVLYWWLA